MAFDLLHVDGRDLRRQPYTERRLALELLFRREELVAPWNLCPSTDDVEVAREWLSWSVVGVEGCVFKDGGQGYRPGARSWRKYRVRDTLEMVVGAVTGTPGRPGSLLLGRFDSGGRLRYAGRTIALDEREARITGRLLSPSQPSHPWAGRTFSVGWGSQETLEATLVHPGSVVEISADIARDSRGGPRHPTRFMRVRADMDVEDVPPFETLGRNS